MNSKKLSCPYMLGVALNRQGSPHPDTSCPLFKLDGFFKKIKKIKTKTDLGQSHSVSGKAFALHSVDLGLILGTTSGLSEHCQE